MKVSQNFVAFSEYMNFTDLSKYLPKLDKELDDESSLSSVRGLYEKSRF